MGVYFKFKFGDKKRKGKKVARIVKQDGQPDQVAVKREAAPARRFPAQPKPVRLTPKFRPLR